jgi:hypothetical protein
MPPAGRPPSYQDPYGNPPREPTGGYVQAKLTSTQATLLQDYLRKHRLSNKPYNKINRYELYSDRELYFQCSQFINPKKWPDFLRRCLAEVSLEASQRSNRSGSSSDGDSSVSSINSTDYHDSPKVKKTTKNPSSRDPPRSDQQDNSMVQNDEPLMSDVEVKGESPHYKQAHWFSRTFYNKSNTGILLMTHLPSDTPPESVAGFPVEGNSKRWMIQSPMHVMDSAESIIDMFVNPHNEWTANYHVHGDINEEVTLNFDENDATVAMIHDTFIEQEGDLNRNAVLRNETKYNYMVFDLAFKVKSQAAPFRLPNGKWLPGNWWFKNKHGVIVYCTYLESEALDQQTVNRASVKNTRGRFNGTYVTQADLDMNHGGGGGGGGGSSHSSGGGGGGGSHSSGGGGGGRPGGGGGGGTNGYGGGGGGTNGYGGGRGYPGHPGDYGGGGYGGGGYGGGGYDGGGGGYGGGGYGGGGYGGGGGPTRGYDNGHNHGESGRYPDYPAGDNYYEGNGGFNSQYYDGGNHGNDQHYRDGGR